MDEFEAFIARVGTSGATKKDAVKNTTKRQTANYILNSPSLSPVKLNDNPEEIPAIVSNKESFNKRLFLFLPDTQVEVGDYVHHDTFTYLATDRNRNDLYPELTGELCNETYTFTTGKSKVRVGTNGRGQPIYEDILETLSVPCVATTKAYSTADNSAIPLPEGTLIVRLPFFEDKSPKVNDEFKIWGEAYQVTDINYTYVIKGKGYLELRLAREGDMT